MRSSTRRAGRSHRRRESAVSEVRPAQLAGALPLGPSSAVRCGGHSAARRCGALRSPWSGLAVTRQPSFNPAPGRPDWAFPSRRRSWLAPAWMPSFLTTSMPRPSQLLRWHASETPQNVSSPSIDPHVALSGPDLALSSASGLALSQCVSVRIHVPR